MKLAILFIGRIKFYTDVKEKLLSIKNKYGATMFCSLNKKNKSPYIETFCNTFEMKEDQIHLERTPEPPQHILSLPRNPHDIRNLYSYFYHVDKCFKLLEKYQEKHNVVFDCILYYRADVYNFDELEILPLKENTVFYMIEPELYYRGYGFFKDILYGNYEVMKKYSMIVNHLENLNKQYKCDHVECFIKHYMVDMNKINANKYAYNYVMHPWRHQCLPEYDYFE